MFKYLKNPGTFTLQKEKEREKKKWKIPSAVLTVCVNGLLKLPLDNCYLVGVKGKNMRIKMVCKSITAKLKIHITMI